MTIFKSLTLVTFSLLFQETFSTPFRRIANGQTPPYYVYPYSSQVLVDRVKKGNIRSACTGTVSNKNGLLK